MCEYMQTTSCLMGFLRNALDDPHVEPCGMCTPCQQRLLWPDKYDGSVAKRAVAFLRHSELPIEPRKKWPAEAFPLFGWKGNIPEDLVMQQGRALCLWGDAGWGDLVEQGKHKENRFSDELVAGVVDMIRTRWKPDPTPTWVTCVPSLNHPTLVSEAAKRFAGQLRLPFVDCIAKTHSTKPQKDMMNGFQQAHNLDGAFAVDHRQVRNGPVLLVDDMVDSRWTFTVLCALLRQAGSGPVYPVALAMTTQGGS